MFWLIIMACSEYAQRGACKDFVLFLLKETYMSPCDDCLNGAKCQANYEKNTGVCNCKRGYVGKNCEKGCVFPLGMETKSIADSQITASSFVHIHWSPKDGRIRNPYNAGVTYGCWRPATAQVDEYLQVDLLAVKNINKVATQGQPYQPYHLDHTHWVTRYALSYSLDGVTWTTYPEELSGNTDRDTVVSHTLPVTILTRYIRFLVKAWNVLPAMRVELYGCEACLSPLGMETKSIADSQITASSFVDFTWSPKDGRIRNSYNAGVTWGCWRPATAQAGEYLQVDLLAVKNINKVATQGQPYTSDQPNLTHWVTRYVLSYSLDGITWTTYPEELSGNTDRDTVVSHTLPVTIQTRYIRFVVKEWNVLPAIRVELYGCEACLSPLGMETKSIADSQITASSFVDIYWSPKDARMRNPYNSGVTFGCWQPANAQAGEYLQVDLLAVKNINKVATQGKPYSSYYLVDHWVTRYALSYSLDGITWTTYPHEFSGNSDDDTVVSHTLPVTIQTRYIRFVVKEWNVLPAMRVELYGCDA
ncbi:lactadherin isoform X2 [Nematostella vectensis]|uniref:lactadherin isoform X2 n=1 Tax=Nematostella vectensis TaxID=45351 RepID=UPI0020778AD5|nr:lactadherin isoform X2 [Nematostella vectensis]